MHLTESEFDWIVKYVKPRKDKEMDKPSNHQEKWQINPIKRKDKTMDSADIEPGRYDQSKDPTPGFEDVQQEGAAYYGQFEAFYYTTRLLEVARELFTKLAITLDGYHGVGDAPFEEQSKALLGESCLMIGALCDAFDFDLEDIVKDTLGV